MASGSSPGPMESEMQHPLNIHTYTHVTACPLSLPLPLSSHKRSPLDIRAERYLKRGGSGVRNETSAKERGLGVAQETCPISVPRMEDGGHRSCSERLQTHLQPEARGARALNCVSAALESGPSTAITPRLNDPGRVFVPLWPSTSCLENINY